MHGYAAMCEQGVLKGAEHTFLGNSRVEGHCGGGGGTHLNNLGSAGQEMQEPAARRS